MSSPDDFSNENSTSPLQRIAIGLGTLVVVTLTVIAAIFLASEDMPDKPTTTPAVTNVAAVTSVAAATEVAGSTPSPTIIRATATSVNVSTEAAAATPTQVPSPTPIPSFTPIPTLTFTPETQAVPTNTPTPTTVAPTQPPQAAPTNTSEPPAASTPATDNRCPTTPPDWIEYEVQVGDTLNLAQRTDISPAEFQEANYCIIAKKENGAIKIEIKEGMIVYLPKPPAIRTPTFTPEPTATPTKVATKTPTPRTPNIYSNNPISEDNDEDVFLDITGRNFDTDLPGFRVVLEGIEKNTYPLELKTKSDTLIVAIVPAEIEPDTYDLWVYNSDNKFTLRRSAYIAKAPQ